MKTSHRSASVHRVVPAALTLVVALVAVPAPEAAAVAPSGANGKIAFSRQPLGGNRDIFVMNADGTGPTNVTNNMAADDQPAFSPDGKKIAFSSNRDGNSEIWVMNVDGSNPVQLTTTTGAFNLNPAWSPNGANIAFQTNRDGGDHEIYAMSATGASPVNLTNSAGVDATPSWSPDGTKIAFRSGRNSGNNEIYVMDAAGSNQTRITTTSQGEFHPDWSPDGTRIVYSRDGGSGGSRDIWAMDAAGTNQESLTDHTGDDDHPVFSPDGTKIAYYALGTTGNGEIYVMDASGTNETPITSDTHADFEPSWGPELARYRPDGQIKKAAEATYIGNNIYNKTGRNQTERAKKKRRTAQVFSIQVQNDGNSVDSFALKGCGDSSKFNLTYYAGMSGTTNISAGVIRGTYSMNNVAPGASRSLRMKIFVKPAAAIGAAKSCLLTAKSKTQTTKKDAVKGKLTVVRG